MRPIIILATLFLLCCQGCSTLLTKYDYAPSLSQFYRNSPDNALNAFPRDKEKGFITTLEKTYLNLLLGKPEINELAKYAAIIDNRLRFDISSNLLSAFYVETPEGYYAAEHEIIWMHLLLGWGYAQRGEMEKASIEARKSARLLSSPWSDEGYFDDPMLRLFLACLWTICGFWEDARVDLRAALKLDPSLDWVHELVHRELPPKHLFLVLGGVGPDVVWAPSADKNIVRGLRNLDFQHHARKTPLYLADSAGNYYPMHISPDSQSWYRRHQLRENAIKEAILDSRYGHRALNLSALTAGKILTGTAIGVSVGAVIVGTGAGIVYLGFIGNSAEVIGIGSVIALCGPSIGSKIVTRTKKRAGQDWAEQMDTSIVYRYVRYLPEFLHIGWTDSDVVYPLTVLAENQPVSWLDSPVTSTSSVAIGYFADMEKPYLEPVYPDPF